LAELARDQAAISAVIDRLYSAALNPDQWSSALDSFAMMTGGMGALLFSPARPEPNMTYVSPILVEAVSQYVQLWYQLCPRTPAGLNPALGDRIWTDEDVLLPEILARSQFHHDYLRTYDLGTQMALSSLQIVPGNTFFLVSQRSRSSGTPTADERKAMAALSSHAVRALQVYRSIAQPLLPSKLLPDVLANLPVGIVVTDAEGRVVFTNPRAEALNGDGFRIDRGQMIASSLRDHAKLTRLIADTVLPSARNADVRPIILQRPSFKKPLVVRAIPISAHAEHRLAHILRGLDLVLLTINDPESESAAVPLEALKAYGLTDSEAAVAAMLGTGSSPQEIADARKVSLTTVRTHIRRIYGKLHITRQGELAKIVAAIKRVL